MTEIQKEQIERMRESGMGYSTIGNALCLSKDCIKTYCRRHSLGGVKESAETRILCPSCHMPVLQNPSRKRKRFCCDACRMAWWNAHPEAVKRKKLSRLICMHCGKAFDSKNPHQKYCTRACYGAARKEASDERGR